MMITSFMEIGISTMAHLINAWLSRYCHGWWKQIQCVYTVYTLYNIYISSMCHPKIYQYPGTHLLMITIPVRCLVSGFTHSSAYCLFSICYTYVTHYTCYTQYTQYTFDIWYKYIYNIYIIIYICIWSGCWLSVKKYVASPSRSDLTPPLGSAFGTAKPPGSPRGTLLRWRTVFWDSFWEVGNLQKTRKG